MNIRYTTRAWLGKCLNVSNDFCIVNIFTLTLSLVGGDRQKNIECEYE